MAVNYLEFAKQQKQLSESLPLSTFSRVCEALSALQVPTAVMASAQVNFKLNGEPASYFGEELMPMLSLLIQAELPTVCQRCFEPSPTVLNLAYAYAVCNDPPEALESHESIEWLEPETHADVYQLIEDELLMALPIAVVHTPACLPQQHASGEVHHPFAALKELLKS